MNFKFSTVFSLALISLIVLGCAKRGRPEGGPKDETAPIMITASPDHLTTNFDDEKIRLNFDEYIKLKELNQQLVISPPMEYPPEITPVGSASDVINIKIVDTLKENTTYTFNFGNSIEDNNEGNPLARFKYVFSTGDYIDSLFVKGSISDAYNKIPDENISIQLYEYTEDFNDSVVYNGRPSYVTNSLDTTIYELTNLKEGKYLMVALLDKNNNYTFEPKLDKIDYILDTVTLPTDAVYNFSLFSEELDFKLTRPAEVTKGHLYFGYEGNPSDIKIDLLSDKPEDFKSALIFEKDYDTISYWHTPIEADSLLFRVEKQGFVDTLTVNLRSKEIDSLVVTLESNSVLSLRDTFKIKTNTPIDKIDRSKISIMDKDSVPVSFITNIHSSKSFLSLDFDKEHENKYKINILPSAITDLYGVANDTINYSASTKTLSDYGSIVITVQNVESFPFIFELLDKSDNVVERIISTDRTNFKFEHLSPDDYMIRIIYDTNKNNKWDTGNFLRRLKPEKVVYYPALLELRANWDLNENFNARLK